MGTDVPTVPAPEPPDSADAWYAPAVHDQYEVVPGVVATVRGDGEPFAYDVREPSLSAGACEGLAAVREHFAEAELRRPRTREGAAERYRDGFDRKYELAIDRLVDCTPSERLDHYTVMSASCEVPLVQ